MQGDDRKFLLLRPGITEPATLAYRNEEEILAKVSAPVQYNKEIIYPAQVRINLEYMENCSLVQDLKCILETIGVRSNRVAD